MAYFKIRVDREESERLKTIFFPAMEKEYGYLYLKESSSWYWYENEDNGGFTYIFMSKHAAFFWSVKTRFKTAEIIAIKPDMNGFIVVAGGASGLM